VYHTCINVLIALDILQNKYIYPGLFKLSVNTYDIPIDRNKAERKDIKWENIETLTKIENNYVSGKVCDKKYENDKNTGYYTDEKSISLNENRSQSPVISFTHSQKRKSLVVSDKYIFKLNNNTTTMKY
jgi:hypothetical protein